MIVGPRGVRNGNLTGQILQCTGQKCQARKINHELVHGKTWVWDEGGCSEEVPLSLMTLLIRDGYRPRALNNIKTVSFSKECLSGCGISRITVSTERLAK
jgi:hypothetical protein